MVKLNKYTLITIILFFSIVTTISCDGNTKETGDVKKFPFGNCVINIKMTLPNGWTSEASSGGWSIYSNDFYPYEKAATWLNVKDQFGNGDGGFDVLFNDPYFIGDKNINELPAIDDKSKIKCGQNYVYLVSSTKRGAAYIDKRLIMPFTITNWPKNGITPEMESFFSSLHVD